jgi:hypothetical protein
LKLENDYYHIFKTQMTCSSIRFRLWKPNFDDSITHIMIFDSYTFQNKMLYMSSCIWTLLIDNIFVNELLLGQNN